MKWKVVAADRETGKERKGIIEAPSRDAAEQQLRRQGLLISSIEELVERTADTSVVVRKAQATVIEIPSPAPLAPNPNLIACPACAKVISLAAASCPHCGHPMRQVAAPPAHQPPPMPQIIMQAAQPTVIHNVVNTSASATATAKSSLGCLGWLLASVIRLIVIAVLLIVVAFLTVVAYLTYYAK